MPDTELEVAELLVKLLEMQVRLAEIEEQQIAIKQQLAATIAKADGLRQNCTKEKVGLTPSDTIPELPESFRYVA